MRAHAWTPPDGLERSRPREVRLTLGGRGLIALSVVLWVAAIATTVALQLESNRQADERDLFAAQSVEARAEVTQLWRDRGEGKPRMVEYRFEVNGAVHTGRERLGASEWSRLRVGAPLPVRYLPGDPNQNRLPGRGRGGLPAFVAYLAGGVLALGAVAVHFSLRCQRRLLSEGRAAQARVTKVTKGEYGSVYEFEFTTLSGRKVKGKSNPGVKPPAVGSSICVVYDPDHPKSSAVYPFSLVTPVYRNSL